MYKVFVNEKKLTISKYPGDIEKKLRFEGFATLEIAVDLLENTSCPELNIYGDDIEEIWEDFTHMFKDIEAAGGIVHNSKKQITFQYIQYFFFHKLLTPVCKLASEMNSVISNLCFSVHQS